MHHFKKLFLAALFMTSPVWAKDIPYGPEPKPPPDTYIDRIHSFISNMYVRPLAWFDRFFMNEREEIEINRSYLRVVTGYEWANRKGFDFQRHIRAKVRLPALKDRLSLVFSGDDKDDLGLGTTGRQEDPLVAAPAKRREENSSVAVRYLLFDWLNSRIDLDAGTQSEFRTQVAARFRQQIPVSEKTMGRLTITGFWLDRTGFGIRPRFDLDRALSPVLGVRWSNQATHVEEGPGIDWESRASMDAQVGRREAVSVAFVAQGPTQPVTVVALYRFSVVYRRMMYRDWVFVEFEPGYNWERSFNNSYPPVPTAGLRLEVRFQD